MAPRAGFEPATCRLTVECSTAELPGNVCAVAVLGGLIRMLFRFAKQFFQKSMEMATCGQPMPRNALRLSALPGYCGKTVTRNRKTLENCLADHQPSC